MCGIAGIVGSADEERTGEAVSAILCALERRGPDDVGTEVWDRAVLGHRRLSIFDLSSAGHQPMMSPDRKLGVVFNGAIYNFRALRDELASAGYQFRSQADTEVLVHGYREWGLDLLVAKLDGMFAIAFWDDEGRVLSLVRDRLGVKPLAFAVENGSIAFASTARALKSAGYGGALDVDGVTEYLEFGFLTDERSIYSGIEKLRAGEILEWHEGQVKRRRYWELTRKTNEIGFGDAVDETERLFLDAVEKRLHADVPVGALLSGGVDSSLVCWAVAKLGGNVTAYTVATPGEQHDESATASQTARTLGIDHRILPLSSDAPPQVAELVSAYPQPFACASALGMLTISREVRKSAKVLLTGDGGDDVFLGYPEHKHFHLASRLARMSPNFATKAWSSASTFAPASGALKRGASFLNYAYGGLAAIADARDGIPVYENHGLFGERLKGKSIPDRNRKWSIDSGRDLLNEFLSYDRRTRFVGEYLPKVDGATMHYALEARSPFLDVKLWEFAATLPFAVRLRGGTSKAILREIARRRIGPTIASGRKQGFVIPVQKWLSDKWRGAFIELMRDSMLDRDGWINARAAIDMLEAVPQGSWAPRQLWFLFVLENWLRYETAIGVQ